MMMYRGVFLLGSNFFGTLWASWISWNSWKSIFFTRLGKFSFLICSNKFSISCSCSSPSGSPIIRTLERLKLSQRFLSLSSFFEFLFLHSVQVRCLFLAFVPNCCFESWFPSCHCWFPEYWVSFICSFFDQAQSVLWASWLLVFWTLHHIGWLSPHCLVPFLEFYSILSFGPYFSVRLFNCKGSGP